MKKFYLTLMAIIAAICTSVSMFATGWPANYQGVMLQGFYWDSYSETTWKQLTAQSDELSKYFKLIWVPNSAQSMGSPTMGYMPIYYFTHHNCSFGTEAELRNMIKTFKEKGTGIIEDVVVNHRVGVTDWADFPTETWNGTTYKMDAYSVCSGDEWPGAKGGPDTGDNYGAARDLDHTNSNVQNCVKNYCKFLIDDLGYTGFRLDMVKGYGGQYTKIYNQYAKPSFSVGEFWEDNYDAIAKWIEATGRESAAFDFPFKYAVNKAFHNGDMTELVWKANGTTDQPAGMIHYGYPQYAVTFVDNHDTAEDGSNFHGNIPAANAYMLCSPGTPCVFWKHYTKYKSEIQKLIAIRNEVGVHNMSPVKVLQSSRDCYMAEVTGTNGKLVIKVGSAMVSPAGYTDSQIKASGNDYCVWTTTQGGVTPDIPSTEAFTVYFKNTSNWTTPYIHYWGASESSWPGVAMTYVKDDIWSYTVPAGTTGILFNAGDGDPTKTGDFVAQANHLYSPAGDQGVYSGGNTPDPNPGTAFNVYFDNTNSNWTTPYIHYWGASESSWPGVAMTKHEGNIWVYTVPAGTTGILFNAGDGDPTKTGDFVAQADHVYNTSGDQGVYSGGNKPDPNPGTDFKVYFDNTNSNWTTPHIHHWGSTETEWPGNPMSKHVDNIWVYTVPAGTTGILFNAGDGDPTKTGDFVAQADHVYTTDGDQGVYTGNDTPTPNPGNYPASLYLIGNVNGYAWAANMGVEAKGNNGVYRYSVEIDDAGEGSGYFAFATQLSTTTDWDEENGTNSGDRYGASTDDAPIAIGQTDGITLYAAGVNASASKSWKIPAGKYNITADLDKMILTVDTFNDTPTPNPGNYPASLYLIGNVNGYAWAANKGVEAKGNNGVYRYSVEIDDAGEGSGYFAFATQLSTTTDWDEENGTNSGDRYGASTDDAPIAIGQTDGITLYAAGINASASKSWKIPAGKYDITADLDKMTLKIDTFNGVTDFVSDSTDVPIIYYNLQGIRVDNPTNGIFIRRQGSTVTKVMVR